MQAYLVLYKNGKPDLSTPVPESGAGIGREAGNHVQLASPEVSKRHALLKLSAMKWCVRDLDSRNGVFVNGKRVREAILQHGDKLTIGPYTLVFETTAPGSRNVMEIDLSSNVAMRTMATPRAEIGGDGNRVDKP
jgi:pSer/pThr/pTyr-binding forkhead associated (FHA) protein